MTPLDALRHYFGFAEFRPGQLEAINHLLAGRDLLTVMPTGAGKSLIYQLAALLLPGTTLVVSPLVALMKDQVDGMTRHGLRATLINSSIDPGEQNHRLQLLSRGEFKIVLVAPERLRSAAFTAALARVSPSLLVVDEAHCLSQWGHDFRPDYLHIADARRALSTASAPAGHLPVTLALTATATTGVQDDIIRLLGLSHAERLVTGFNRPNIFFEVRPAPDLSSKLRLVRDFLIKESGAGIIYTGTRRDAEEVAEFVRSLVGLEARHYHAGLDNAARAQVQEGFLAGDVPIIAATNAFGMGIDRPDVRFVLHFTMPGTLEAYYQEAGRGGRDGLPARAVLLYSNKDTALHESFIENDSPTESDLRAVHDFLCRTPSTTFEELERAGGWRQVLVRVAVEELEAGGVLRRLPQAGLNTLSVEVLPLPETTLQNIAERVEARKRHKRALLGKMVAYAETNACRRRTILDYFGDSGAADAPLCCDNDLARRKAETEPREQSSSDGPTLVVLDAVAKLKWNLGKEKLALLLKGSGAKEIARYVKAPHYGALADLRLTDIESLLGRLLAEGYLKQIGGDYPTLKLSARGEAALRNRAAIAVHRPQVDLEKVHRLKLEREAGGTLALTANLLARGLSPGQIAEQRALTPGTIYSHLAQLIAEGRVELDQVVSLDTQQQIRGAIEQVGSAQYLAPIKARLPDSICYELIRCVANAWLHERGLLQPTITKSPTPRTLVEDRELFERLRRWRLEKARAERVPAFAVFADETLRCISAAKPQSLKDLLGLRGVGQVKAQKYGAELLSAVREYTSVSAPQELTDETLIAQFLASAHPRPLEGHWLAGWALDFHSRFSGDVHERSAIGELVYRYKYGGETSLARDLAQHWAGLLAAHPELPKFDAVIPVPPSTPRDVDPVTRLAEALAQSLSVPVLNNTLIKTRVTERQKEMTSLAQKLANVAGAFALRGQVRGKHLILVDDLYDSGATLNEAARALARGGAESIVVLTLTKTIHADS